LSPATQWNLGQYLIEGALIFDERRGEFGIRNPDSFTPPHFAQEASQFTEPGSSTYTEAR